MTDILDESMADQIVIANLINHIRKLEKIIMERKLLFDEAGTMYVTHSYEVVSPEELKEDMGEVQAELDELAKARDFAAKLAAGTPAAPAQPAAPVDATPAAPAAPAVPEAPVAPVLPQQPIVLQ